MQKNAKKRKNCKKNAKNAKIDTKKLKVEVAFFRSFKTKILTRMHRHLSNIDCLTACTTHRHLRI